LPGGANVKVQPVAIAVSPWFGRGANADCG